MQRLSAGAGRGVWSSRTTGSPQAIALFRSSAFFATSAWGLPCSIFANRSIPWFEHRELMNWSGLPLANGAKGAKGKRGGRTAYP